jgi:DNA-binding protein Fis
MSVEQATWIEPVSKHRDRDSFDGLRLGERPPRNRVERLVDLATGLLEEAETLARDRVFSEQATKLRRLDVADGIDFYEEVVQFETDLIKMALERTGGNQARAAALLRIKPTTLNSKIKLYGIEYRP